eukprot:TRINITY_DN83_c0_g1_i8.p2 TRINITY_DN83_c0_g1~~TRINITY_DN83_c0_g1_i8.p2  ORF type:complete len:365 (+),score=1.77 TRINITY_DN83_c0_g1_i8:143-1096(+)
MARVAFLATCFLLLLATSLAQPGGPRGFGGPGGMPGGMPGGGRGAMGGSSGNGGSNGGPPQGGLPPPRPAGPPLNLTAVGNLTAEVGARLPNCSADKTVLDAHVHVSIFKNATGNFNIVYEALFASAGSSAVSPPDSLAIVQGAACDAAAPALLTLPAAAADWEVRDGWWYLHASARLDGFIEDANVAAVDSLLAAAPNASLPAPPNQQQQQQGGGQQQQGTGAGSASAGRLAQRFAQRARKQLGGKLGGSAGGQQQGGQQQRGPQQGGPQGTFGMGAGGANSTVAGYAVLASNSAAGVTWGAVLMGAKIVAPAAAV